MRHKMSFKKDILRNLEIYSFSMVEINDIKYLQLRRKNQSADALKAAGLCQLHI